MSVETALRALLVADSGITALVSTRVAALKAAQSDDYPKIEYHRTGGGKTYALGRVLNDRQAFYQVDCWAESYLGARAIADAVSAAVTPNSKPYRGTIGGVTFQGVFVSEDFDALEPPAYGDDVGYYWVPIGLTVWHDV